MPKEENALAIFTRGARMLAEATSIQQNKELKILGITAAEWARRKGMGEEAVATARAFALTAEWQMGNLLEKSERAKGKLKQGPVVPMGNRGEPTLAELGITKKESSAAQKLAALPKKLFQAVLDGAKTRAAAFHAIKDSERAKKEEAAKHRIKRAKTIQDALGSTKFSTIVVDPPWDWDDEGDATQFGRGRTTYGAMSHKQLLEFPLGQYGDTNSHLYLWITNRSLPKGFGLIEAWGYRYVTCLTWCKPSIGMGNYFRGSTEHVLFCIRGSLPLKRKDVGSWFAAPRGKEHSAKPDELYALVESCSPGPYLDVFSRRERDGWVCWGGELS